MGRPRLRPVQGRLAAQPAHPPRPRERGRTRLLPMPPQARHQPGRARRGSRPPLGRGGMPRDHQVRRRIRPAPGPPLDRLTTPHHPLHVRRSAPRRRPGAPAGKRHRLADGMIPNTCNEIRRLPATAVLLPERGKRHLLRWSRRRRRHQASAELSHHKRRDEEGLHPDRTVKIN